MVELQTQRPIALELYKDFKELGRFMLRYSGSTIAAGVVTEVFKSDDCVSMVRCLFFFYFLRMITEILWLKGNTVVILEQDFKIYIKKLKERWE